MIMKKDLYGMSIEEMQEFAVSLGEKSYRGRQLFRWIHVDGDEGTSLPRSFRERIAEETILDGGHVSDVRTDPKDGTVKLLYEMADGEAVEGVFMRYRYGNTLCVSSQIGCRMGCVFCASTIGGRIRDLTTGEMVAQLMLAEEETGEKVDHIVIMGMGEPFDNYDNVAKFLRIMHEEEGRKMSWRNMTVSTDSISVSMTMLSSRSPARS